MGSRMSYFRHPECDVMGGAGSKRSRLSDEAERMKVRETTVGCFAGVRGDFFKNTRCVGKHSVSGQGPQEETDGPLGLGHLRRM